MLKEAMQYLISLGNVDVLDVEGQKFSTKPLYQVDEARVKSITVNSLSGLSDYLESHFDAILPVMIHVESPTIVSVYSGFNRDKRRNLFLQAEAMIPEFHFERWYDLESFNIALQSMFVDTKEKAQILRVVGNVKDENVDTFGDDGISQQVTAKTGIATVASVRVPNPVYLKPFRSFVEVEQPESAFVLRMRKGPETPEAALFEADGGAWKIEAMYNVKEFLQESIQSEIVAKRVTLIS